MIGISGISTQLVAWSINHLLGTMPALADPIIPCYPSIPSIPWGSGTFGLTARSRACPPPPRTHARTHQGAAMAPHVRVIPRTKKVMTTSRTDSFFFFFLSESKT